MACSWIIWATNQDSWSAPKRKQLLRISSGADQFKHFRLVHFCDGKIQMKIIDRLSQSNRNTILSVWCFGLVFWLISIPMHNWNSQFQAIGCDVGIIAMAYMGLRGILISASTRIFRILYVYWFALFGATFLITTYFSLADFSSAALFLVLIGALVWIRNKYA